MKTLRAVLCAALLIGSSPAAAGGSLSPWSYSRRCSSYLLQSWKWLSRQPDREVATQRHGTLLFTFGQGKVEDKVEILGRTNKYLVYSGRITRIPVRLPGLLRPMGKVPAAVAHRVSSYTDDHANQWEHVNTISTVEGALILSFVPQHSQIELGIGMEKRGGVYTIFRIPTRLKYLAKAAMGCKGPRIPPSDDEVTWEITMYGTQYALVTLAESETSKNYFRGGPELRAAMEHLVDRPDGTRVFDFPQDNQQTWIVKSSGLFADRAPEAFPYSIHEFGTHAMKLADHAFSHQAKMNLISGKLTVAANGPQSVDSEYIFLGDVEHASASWDLTELDRPSSEIPAGLSRGASTTP